MKLKVISFNLAAVAKDWQRKAWKSRLSAILKAVNVPRIAIVLAQETGSGSTLTDLDRTWQKIGLVRAPKGGRWRHIYYRKSRFRVIRSGLFSLNPGNSKHAAWAVLEARRSKIRVFVVSVHHTAGNAYPARKAEAKRLVKLIDKHNPRDLPVILGGDFNDPAKLIREVYEPAGYVQARKKAKIKRFLSWSSYATWGKKNAKAGVHLDHILVRGEVEVIRAQLRRAQRFASDHLPILAVLRIRRKK